MRGLIWVCINGDLVRSNYKSLLHINRAYAGLIWIYVRKVFSNIMVHTERGISHIPYVVVCPYGIFVITCCHHVGKVLGHKNDPEWNIRTRGIRETILNPLWENRKHINALEKKLGLEGVARAEAPARGAVRAARPHAGSGAGGLRL